MRSLIPTHDALPLHYKHHFGPSNITKRCLNCYWHHLALPKILSPSSLNSFSLARTVLSSRWMSLFGTSGCHTRSCSAFRQWRTTVGLSHVLLQWSQHPRRHRQHPADRHGLKTWGQTSWGHPSLPPGGIWKRDNECQFKLIVHKIKHKVQGPSVLWSYMKILTFLQGSVYAHSYKHAVTILKVLKTKKYARWTRNNLGYSSSLCIQHMGRCWTLC